MPGKFWRLFVPLCGSLCWLAVTAVADERPPEVQTLLPGVKLTMVAEHPGLATPTGIDVDRQGRIWAVSTHTHFRPENYVGPKFDEILIFSDGDGDGQLEQRQVFYNATEATMDLELGLDGWVYLAERDRILRIKDADGDGKAEVVENLAVLQTEANYPHNGLEGLAWHPDGDLLFTLGENYAKPWTLTGVDGQSMQGSGEGGIFRCTADGRQLRRIARGFWNPFGLCVRADGEMFAAENDPGEQPPCRLLHVVEGGDYGYQRAYGDEAHHPFVAWNGELRGTLPMLHPSGEAPCAVLPLGRGLLVPSWSDHRIDFCRLKPHGASYQAERLPLVHGGKYFRPGCLAADPRSTGTVRAWYFTDWVDGSYQAHGYGRVWKLEVNLDAADWVGPLELEPPTDAAKLAAGLRGGKTKMELAEALKLAGDEDPFLARAALVALSREAADWEPAMVALWSAPHRVSGLLAAQIAGVKPEPWLQMFLADSDPTVQFEALRWAAEAGQKSFLPQVEAVLNRSDLDYRLFEAAVAAWNTLQGHPEQGLRNEEMLLARVRDERSTPQLRAFALRLLPTQSRTAPKDGSLPVRNFPKGLTLELLEQLLAVNDPTLSLEVVRTLAGNPAVSQASLSRVASDPQASDTLRAEAVLGLAAVAEQQLPLLLQLAGDDRKAIREEALRALRGVKFSPEQTRTLEEMGRQHPDSADLLIVLLNPESLTTDRPALTDTAAWQKTLAAVNGTPDPDAGSRIFHHARVGLCANCHRHQGRGNVVGPDLSALSRRQDSRWLLQSILEPSREMAPEYQPRTILLKNGQTFTGIRLRSSTQEALRDAHGQNQVFNRDAIESMVESNISFMPIGLPQSLTARELRDLIAFLERQPRRD